MKILLQEDMQPEVIGPPMFKTHYQHTVCAVPEYLQSMLAVHGIFSLERTLLDVCRSIWGSSLFCICQCSYDILITYSIRCKLWTFSSTVNQFPLDFIAKASFCFRCENGSQLVVCLHSFLKRVRHVEGIVQFIKK